MTTKVPDEPEYSKEVREWLTPGPPRYSQGQWTALWKEHGRQFAEWGRRKRREELPGMLLGAAGSAMKSLFYIALITYIAYEIGTALGCRMLTRPWWM
jgi:hypothetical protein